MRLMVEVGLAERRSPMSKCGTLACQRIEVDEIWSYVGYR